MSSGVISALIFFLPLWAANIAMSFAGVLNRYSPLLDFGRNWFDGRRIIGESKHYNGVFLACIAGLVVGWLCGSVWIGFLMGIAAALGDTLNSFLKRRLNIPSGGKLPILDELNYVIAGFIILVIFVGPVPVEVAALVIIISLLLHRPTCWLGYELGLRSRPW